MLSAGSGLVLIACLLGAQADKLSSQMRAELDRLVGLEVELQDEGYLIVDVAGEGAPLVGCVERAGPKLFLDTGHARQELVGPLAVPRIAGPDYKVWVIGETDHRGRLWARRLGILAGPRQSGCFAKEARNDG